MKKLLFATLFCISILSYSSINAQDSTKSMAKSSKSMKKASKGKMHKSMKKDYKADKKDMKDK